MRHGLDAASFNEGVALALEAEFGELVYALDSDCDACARVGD